MAGKLNKKILIVEDDKDLLYIIKLKFDGAGFSVVTAEDGPTGIALAEKEKPDLIISDVLMPKMDGIEMIKEIKKFDKNVLFLFLTNVKDADYAKSAENLEGFDYLIKSDVQIEDIIDRVKTKLGLGGAKIPDAPKKGS